MINMNLKIIGAGLAGCEAAWQAAQRGIRVTLCEMKPEKYSPAHHNPDFAELVCSNSLRADGIYNAVGLLKEEMRRLGSLIMECADACKVPAGGALAVDRDEFSRMITERITAHPLIDVKLGEISEINTDEYTIIAAGPLVSDKLADEISRLVRQDHLHFFDAAAPIVSYDSLDMTKAFRAARYGKGGADYINCPMNKDEYMNFYRALISAETAELHGFETGGRVFEGCMPIEVMANRGEDTMRYGPLKPVGLDNPITGERYYAVVQLRQDNAESSMYNIVGFQTHLKFGEQKRVFGMIPGLENAEFVRYGVMHRNTYINSPTLLDSTYSLKAFPKVYFAGQITGVEGYVESASSGLLAGIYAAERILGGDPEPFSAETAIGALAQYVSNGGVSDFQPMNVNYGIIVPLGKKIRDKRQKAELTAERSFAYIDNRGDLNAYKNR